MFIFRSILLQYIRKFPPSQATSSLDTQYKTCLYQPPTEPGPTAINTHPVHAYIKKVRTCFVRQSQMPALPQADLWQPLSVIDFYYRQFLQLSQ